MENRHGTAAQNLLAKARRNYRPFPLFGAGPEWDKWRALEADFLEEVVLKQLAFDIYNLDGNKYAFAKKYTSLKTKMVSAAAKMRQDKAKSPENAAMLADLYMYQMIWQQSQMADWFFIRWATEQEVKEVTMGPVLKPMSLIIEKYAAGGGGCTSAILMAISVVSSAVACCVWVVAG